jgi:hypothetical protein
LVNKIVLENSILSNSESCDGYPFNLQQFRDLIFTSVRAVNAFRYSMPGWALKVSI